jgi:hypothetical protein
MMIFYNGFNLLVDIVIALIVGRMAYNAGWSTGWAGRDAEIEYQNDVWQDYYYEAQREMRD